MTITVTAAAVFEELRFVWELVGALLIFLLPFAKRKPHFLPRFFLSILLLSVLSFVRFPLEQLDGKLPWLLFTVVMGGSYVCLTLLAILRMRSCFSLTVSDALYIGTLAYSTQHIVYVLIHECLAMEICPWLKEHLAAYFLAALCGCGVVYPVAYRLFVHQLRFCNGSIYPDSPFLIALHGVGLAVLTLSTMSCQLLFEWSDPFPELGALVDLMFCSIIISLQYSALSGARLGRERSVIEQILRDSASQYSLSKELIDHINRTCHDLKHNLNVLKTIEEAERQSCIEETQRKVELYHQLVHTKNEVLNTILAEKSLYCDSRQIQLSCVVDADRIAFISVPDLYALLGNAIDNAIECVERFDDIRKRVISLTIRQQNSFLCIQTNNYCEEQLKQEDGLPITTKSDRMSHGFGLKSIRYLADKYGGTMRVTVQNCVFILQIMLPLPPDL